MLTQLSSIKSRLALTDAQYDDLLTAAIKAVSVRFDHECNRTLARTVGFTQEFDADSPEICAACYPIETVTKFELKASEAAGWQEIQPTPDYLIRRGCVISLVAAPRVLSGATLDQQPATGTGQAPLARVTYTGGYLLPGDAVVSGATRLPDDLEQAAVEQVAFWFQNKDTLGVIRQWPKGGVYKQFEDLDLLPNVHATLAAHTRLIL
jgi:hypothetical protein